MNDTDAHSSKKISELQEELNSVNQSLFKTKEALRLKEGNIESLKSGIQKAKELEEKLAEKDAALEWMKAEIDTHKASESNRKDGKIHDYVVEKGMRNESEANMLDSLVAQTKHLEETKILLEESRLEIDFLRNKLAKLEDSNGRISSPRKLKASFSFTDKVDSSLSPSQIKDLLVEVDALKDELTKATQAEEKSKKAMDDLALALKEVATENKNMNEKSTFYRVELERTKEEVGRLRSSLKKAEEKLRETMDEAEKYKNTAERLQLEAEDSNLAWNDKEIELVNCIKRAEEDIGELVQKLEMSEKTSKEENMMLRDILKQALNEANIAKEAAEIARAENATLQDYLAAKEHAVELLTRENESLKVDEAAYLENINELKRIISGKSATDENDQKDGNERGKPSTKESEEDEKPSLNEFDQKTNMHPDGVDQKEHSVKIQAEREREPSTDNESDHATGNETSFHSPESGTQPDGESIHSEECEHLDEHDLVHCEDRNCKKKKALLRRVGDILRRRSFYRKESSLEQ